MRLYVPWDYGYKVALFVHIAVLNGPNKFVSGFLDRVDNWLAVVFHFDPFRGRGPKIEKLKEAAKMATKSSSLVFCFTPS